MSSINGSNNNNDDNIEEFDVEIEPIIARKQVTIPLPKKSSTWANINPSNPCLDNKEESPIRDRRSSLRERSTSITKDTVEEVTVRRRGRKPKLHDDKQIKRRGRRPKSQIQKEALIDGESEPEESEQSETFDLEMILDHREIVRKKKKITEYLVRWLGYDASNDTWEPEENILGDYAKEQLKIYWERKQAESADTPEVDKQKKMRKKRVSIIEDKQQTPAKKRHENEENDTRTDISHSSESALDMSDEASHNWFGIKEEDVRSKHAKREFKNLYVSDRKLSLSEKLLADFGSNSTGRVTRSSLKPLKEDIEPTLDDSSVTPPPTNKRRRLTESPATRYSPEPPVTKRGRKSLPARTEKSTVITERTRDVPVRMASQSVKELTKKEAELQDSTPRGTPKSSRASSENAQFSNSPSNITTTAPCTSEQQSLTTSNSTTKITSINKCKNESDLPLLEPIEQPILDPRAKKSKELISQQQEQNQNEEKEMNESVNNQSSFYIGEAEYEASNEVENDEKKIQTSIDHLAFNKLKEYKDKEIDPELLIKNIQEKEFDRSKLVNSYDDFVAAVINADAAVVHTTLYLKPDAFNLNERDNEGRTLLHHIALLDCTEQHKFDVISRLLALNGAELSFTDNIYGRTPLHTAVCSNKQCIVEILLEAGSPINTLDKNKKTPLMSAVISNNINLTKLLLRTGANIHDITEEIESVLSNEMKKTLQEHRNHFNACMDAARFAILPQAKNEKGTISSSIFICPIAEANYVEYTFDIINPEEYQKPNQYLLFECGLIGIDKIEGLIKGRLWQQSPIKRISINHREPINLHKTTNFISLPQLRVGKNVIKLELMNQTYFNTNFCIASRISHISMNGYSRSRKTDPITRNLMPLGMGCKKAPVPPAMRQLATELKMRCMTPILPLSRQNTPAKRMLAKQLNSQNAITQPNILPTPSNNGNLPKLIPQNKLNDNLSSTPSPSTTMPVTTRPSPVTSNNSASSTPLAGFIPLKKASLTNFNINRTVTGNKPLVTPLTAANNRAAVKQSQPTTTITTSAQSPVSETQLKSNNE